ncbi:uncharacterized protein LOC133186929 [Saccostrea echinata]|uniref:uncharacterized protein LOC133186929 n=1 Tax=Saccostrea echinata TaxID=191078 RepID=UPI002A8038B1|nr:uncharacterized protein LOC133186929 [Saccostrea echinata]
MFKLQALSALLVFLVLSGVLSMKCSSKSGSRFSAAVLWNRNENYKIDTTCPCVAMTTTLPQCHIHHLISKINHVASTLQNKYRSFQLSIASPQPAPCTDIRHHHHASAPHNPDLSAVLLQSYKTVSLVSLNVAIVQRHNNSRIQELPTSELGRVLCYMKRLLFASDVSSVITGQSVTVEPMDISQIVPFTCQTLKDSVHLLKQVKTNILETFYSRLK